MSSIMAKKRAFPNRDLSKVPGVVYGLASSTIPDLVRYVGFTSGSLEKRRTLHIKDAGRYPKRAVCVWINECFAKNEDIFVLVLKKEATLSDEVEIIRSYKERGAILVNETQGGLGHKGMPISDAKKAAFALPASEGLKAHLREYNKNRDYSILSEKAKARYKDPENRRLTSEALKLAISRRTPEQKRASVEKRLATLAARRSSGQTETT